MEDALENIFLLDKTNQLLQSRSLFFHGYTSKIYIFKT